MKKLMFLSLFILIVFAGCSKEEKVNIQYKFKQGQKFLSNVTTISTKPKENEKNTFEFDFETLYKEVIDNGEKAKLSYNFVTFKMDGVKNDNTLPGSEGTIDKSGKITLDSIMLQNFQPTIILPTKPIAAGKNWESLLTIPIQGQNFSIVLDAKFEKIVDYENKKAIYITYSGSKDDIKINESEYKAEITGSMYFDNELGMYIKVNTRYITYAKINNAWEKVIIIDVSTNFKKIIQ